MKPVAQRSFGQRVLLLSLFSAGAALLIALIGFTVYEYLSSMDRMRERLIAIAAVIADNSAPALAFRDENAANEVLGTLRSVPEVSRAILFDSDGKPFAVHPRSAQPAAPEPRPRAARVDFAFERIEARTPLRMGGEPIGHLLVEAGLRALYVRLGWYALTSLVLVAGALAASTLLLAALRRRLTDAEQALAEMTRTLDERVRHRTAELESANRELESFGYSVSHDLRAPVRAMAGFAGILREDYGAQLPAAAMRSLRRIEDNAIQMGKLIDDLLELSRAGRSELRLTRVDMRSLAASVVRDLGDSARHADIRIEAIPEVHGDATLLRQVWYNLIGNALKFTRDASPARVEIGGARRESEVEYFVRDNGAGFEMQYLKKLFGVFERLHSPGEYEGSGIGLAIVLRIVQRHGGSVSAQGAPGQGASFHFVLPDRPGERGLD